MSCLRGLRDRGRVERARQIERLRGDLPDREQSTEDDNEIYCALEDAPLFFLRANQQCVGRLESIGGGNLVFHKLGRLMANPLCKARATRIFRVIKPL